MSRRTATEAILVMAVAGCLWGSSFALVEVVSGTNPMLVTGLRFVLYGLISMVVLAFVGWRGIDWRTAFLHAATGYVGMYLAEVVAIQLAGPGPTIAVIGSVPVVYALIGARRDGIALSELWPSVSILLVAMALINANAFAAGDDSVLGVVAGMVVAGVGVASWCVYALHNTDHLERNPEVTAAGWSSAVGVAAGTLAVPLLLIGSFGAADSAGRLGPVVLFLAIGPSWVATVLWNRASLRVPRALAGQLIVFEPMSAFVLVHLLAGRGPSPVQFVGEVLLVVGAAVALARLHPSGGVERGDQVVGPGQERVAGLVAG
jgi:drug/metabolite transporter (DMT)-like permease